MYSLPAFKKGFKVNYKKDTDKTKPKLFNKTKNLDN